MFVVSYWKSIETHRSCVGLNDLGADSYPIDVPEQLEDEAGADSDNENLIDDDEVFRDGDNTTEVESDDDVENDTEDEDDLNGEGKQLDDEQLLQSENVRYLVLQLVKRIRACVANIRSTRAVNDHVKRKASSNEPPIKFALITDFETRWNTTFVMIDRFCIYRTIIDDTNSRPFKIVHISPTQQLKLGSKEIEFTNDDWCSITDLYTILKPFMIATNVVSAKIILH
ncbi:unnamed protein product [Rotaria magnacalcarata]|uniref:Transposase n=1 Tax=Rotaria magnacalcarata TaxID=392030 RepID=A0A816PWJ8_9BILA|nr:unnamed protein product [Rotaria magnacalcarata]